ncbi:cytochrome c oxidase subunit VIa [Aspergillus undulatus]|uniref:cytochrome c oxidase subunit VIa n=1 Tax=Aspergillus undulatus TaxID=1810928 RepID=UPI003CCCC117
MIPQHVLRLAQRSAPVRSAIQRRFNSTEKLPSWVVDNEFNRERAAVKHHAASTSSLWLKLSIFAVIPCLIGGGWNAYSQWNEHWEHWEHMTPLEERTEYPYQNIRSKNFPWGDGDKLELQRQLPQQGQISSLTWTRTAPIPENNDSMMSRPDVLVVGAGPSGLVTALWLTKQGVSVRIIDKAKTDVSTSRALAIQARTLELYRQLDIAEDVVSKGHKIEATNVWSEGTHRGRIPIGNVGTGLTPYPFIHILSQDQHERILEDRLNSLGVHVERNRELIGFRENGSSITAQLRRTDSQDKRPTAGIDNDFETCEATFIVGCDGAHSAVRHTAGIEYDGATYSHIFFVADIEGSGPTVNGDAHVTLNESEFILLFPYDDNRRARVSGAIDDRTAQKGTDICFEDVAPEIKRTLKLQIDKLNWFSTYRSHHRVAAAFRKGRAFLVGDAAHIHSPVGGQGMNAGIQDAINLTWKLSVVIKGQAGLSLLDSYETERRAFANNLVSTTDSGFNAVISQSYFARTLRTWVVPFVSQIWIDYRHSTLSAGAAGYVHGGDRMPWAIVGDVDNFESLKSISWQVQVYGAASPVLKQWCQTRDVALHTYTWDEKYQEVGLQKDAAYLIRPDTYIAVAEPAGNPQRFDQYFETIGL